jgi:2'-5' RNA ligase
MRLFLAIYPPKEYTKYFGEVYKKFDKQKRNLQPTPYDQVHLTLRFIGANVSEGSKDKILELLKRFEGQYTKPSIGIDSIQFGFERQRDPRYLIANIAEDPGLIDLNNEVYQLIKSLRLKDTIRWKDKHSNDFHITLARMKPTATKSSGKIIRKLVEDTKSIMVPPNFTPETYDLVESIVKQDGPVYRKIESIRI